MKGGNTRYSFTKEVIQMENVTNSFTIFLKQTGNTGKAYMDMVMQLSKDSALDRKTHELAYISVLAAIDMTNGLPFHVKSAKQLGASEEEIKSAILVGIPVVGITVIDALEIALQAYQE